MRTFFIRLWLSLLSAIPWPARAVVCEAPTQLRVALHGVRGLRPVVQATVNGRPAMMIFDTGGEASFIIPEAAARLSLADRHRTVSFRSFGQPVTADVFHADALQIGASPPVAADLLALPAPSPNLDGMLGWPEAARFDVLVDLPSGVIDLLSPVSCDGAGSTAWILRPDVSVVDLETAPTRPIGHVRVNGIDLRALFDTGTPDTSLTEAAARRAGVVADGPEVEEAGTSGGLGSGGLATWRGLFRSVQVGREQMKDVHLLFMRKPNASADMIIGADFFRTHRVLISKRRQKLYVIPSDPGGFLGQSRVAP